jgi:hypothetical protein
VGEAVIHDRNAALGVEQNVVPSIPHLTCEQPESSKIGILMAALDTQRVREINENFASARLERLSEVSEEKIDFISHAPPTIFLTFNAS